MKNSKLLFWLSLSFLFIGICVCISCKTTQATSAVSNSSGSATFANKTIWGSSASPFPNEKIDRIEAWKRLNEKVKSLNGGYGLQGRRTYDKGLPASWATSSMADDTGLCKISFGSIKPDWIETAMEQIMMRLRNLSNPFLMIELFTLFFIMSRRTT